MSTMEQKKTKKSKKIEEVLEPSKQTVVEETPKKSRAKKTEVKEIEVSEPKKSRTKKTEVKEIEVSEEKPKLPEAKKSRAKKVEDDEQVEVKPKKSRAKKTESKEESSEVSEEKPQIPEPKKSRTKKTEAKEVIIVAKSTDDTKDSYIKQSEIDDLLLFSQKCKTSILTSYDGIMDNISHMQKNLNSIDTIRASTNNIYKNMFEVLSNNNLLINHIHNLHTNFVLAANSKLSKEQYLEITKECCANIDKLRDTYINNADHHNDSLTKLFVQLNDFLESLQNPNSFKLDKTVKSVINSDSDNSDTGSDKLDAKKLSKPKKSLKLEKSIIKSESESDSE